MTGSNEQRPMDDPVWAIARAAALRLAPECEQRIVADVEAALHKQDLPQPPGQYLDPISLGGLIVGVAALAWSVYADLRRRNRQPPADAIERTMRVRLRSTEAIDPSQRDRIVEIVVEETLRIVEGQGP